MDHPAVQQPEKVYFQVMIEYEDCEATSEIPEDSRSLESEILANYPKAVEVAQHTIQAIHGQFKGSSLVELELDEMVDGYHLLVVDDAGSRIAKVGIAGYDYSEETIH